MGVAWKMSITHIDQSVITSLEHGVSPEDPFVCQ